MPARHKISLIELMIIAAIVGILISIIVPASQQARLRARGRANTALQPPGPSVAPDGQLNTIEVSELSEHAERRPGVNWVRMITGVIPALFPAIFAIVVIIRFRKQLARPRAH